MRVIHVMPDISRAFGGPTSALLGFLAACRAAGIDAAVAAPMPSPEDLAWFREQAGETPVHVFPSHGRGSARIAPAMIRAVRARVQPRVVVHVHGLFNAVSTSVARSCRQAGIPYLIGPFGTLSRYTFAHKRALMKRAYFALLDAPAIRGAGAMHFTTVHERDEARRLAPVRAVPSVVVPPAWVEDAGSAIAIGPRAPDTGANSSPETVLFLSRLHPIKAIESLLDAWPAVLAQRPRARLIIAGSGDADYTRGLEFRVQQSRIGDSVQFLGFVTGADKARWLARADVFVLPSFHENFGVSVLEAVAAGVPVVVSPDVQLAGVVAEHGLGAVVSRDAAALANGILAVLADPPLRQRAAAEGRAIVKSLFSPGIVGVQLEAMYEIAVKRFPG